MNRSEDRMDSLLEGYIAEQKNKNRKIKELVSNTNYINWLDYFTIKHKNFSDDDWLYFPEKITDSDRKQVEKLSLFYNGIEKYAQKNYIYPIIKDYDNFYKIRLDNVGYEIGISTGQGTVFFCNRVEINKREEFIDFNDIIKDKKADNVIMIENKLEQLSNMIVSLYESGVPLEAIDITLDKTLNEINSQKKSGTSKVLKK